LISYSKELGMNVDLTGGARRKKKMAHVNGYRTMRGGAGEELDDLREKQRQLSESAKSGVSRVLQNQETLKATIDAQKQEIAQLKAQIDALNAQISDKDAEIARLTQELAALTRANADLQTEMDTMRHQLSTKFEGQCEELQAASDTQISKLKADIAEASQERDTASAKRDELQQQVHQVQGELDAANAELATLRQTIDQNQQQISQLNDRNAGLEEIMANYEKSFTELNRQLNAELEPQS